MKTKGKKWFLRKKEETKKNIEKSICIEEKKRERIYSKNSTDTIPRSATINNAQKPLKS